MGSLQALSSLSCWELYTEPGGSHSRGQEGLVMVPAGYMEVNHLILCVVNICIYKGYLDLIQVYKETLLFSDRCIISLVVLLIFVRNSRALKFLENGFPPHLVSW